MDELQGTAKFMPYRGEALRVTFDSPQLDRIERKIDRILGLETKEMADLTRITDEVTQNTEVVSSAVALITDLANEIRNAGTDPAALDALAAQLDASSQALADAVAANTPAAPPV